MILKAAYGLAIKQLSLANCNQGLEARLLLQHILTINEVTFLANIANIVLNSLQINKLQKLIKLRNTGYPLAYIIGYKHFWQDKFTVTKDVLIPRPETETLVAAVLKTWKLKVKNNREQVINILDIGVGSGCILLSLLKELPLAFGVGVDISKEALMIAQKNAKLLNIPKNRIALLQQDLFTSLKPSHNFDIIVSNPPYIAYNDKLIAKDVKKFEPKVALFAKKHGFYFYQVILKNAANYLSKKGTLFLEAGIGQKEQIIALNKSSQMYFKKSFKDYLNIDRVIMFSL